MAAKSAIIRPEAANRGSESGRMARHAKTARSPEQHAFCRLIAAKRKIGKLRVLRKRIVPMFVENRRQVARHDWEALVECVALLVCVVYALSESMLCRVMCVLANGGVR
jgi:hypothetical protein